MTRDVLVEALSDLGDMGFAAVFKSPDGVLVLASRRRRSWDLPSQCGGVFRPPRGLRRFVPFHVRGGKSLISQSASKNWRG